MFYKYPKEFIVSVKYDKSLEVEFNNIDSDVSGQYRRFRLIDDDYDNESRMLLYDENMKNNHQKGDMNKLDMYDEMSDEDMMLKDNTNLNLKNEEKIFNEIDEEYANSQVGNL